MRLTAFILVLWAPLAGAQPGPRAFLDRYCLGCHNQELKTAGLSFEGLQANDTGRDEAVWEKILRKVRAGEMPPPQTPRPDDRARADFSAAVESALDREAATHPNPGRPAIQRLNRAEYGNAIRDLLVVDVDVTQLLPPDDSGYGFDNIGDVLSVSPALLDRYLAAAKRISRTAVSAAGAESPSRKRIFVCEPGAAWTETPCARTILGALARRAYRRPVTAADLAPLLRFYEAGREAGGFDGGIEMAVRAMLVSPEFLLRIEHDPAGSRPGTAGRVGDVELASRLSFFLWSSIPDEELLGLAERGKLHEAAVLEQQVCRMLEDRRSAALVTNFAAQWLFLGSLATARPQSFAFPEFDEDLRRDFRRETELFLSAVMHSKESVADLLDSDYTFLNERLARHYGIAGVEGSDFRRVTLTDTRRGGLLGQASILTVTSYPTRTSVVLRGKWILENLLGDPPPPAPPDIPSLKPETAGGRPLSLREQMAQHAANGSCASCHARMDALGFALENYDGVGKWRGEDAGKAIDAGGKLPDGTEFSGLPGLKKILLRRQKEFIATLTGKLLTYALGRGLESYDQPAVRAIDREAAQNHSSFSAIVEAIVKSVPFQMRRAS